MKHVSRIVFEMKNINTYVKYYFLKYKVFSLSQERQVKMLRCKSKIVKVGTGQNRFNTDIFKK